MFKASLFEFLDDLGDNNNREWFNAHKAAYEADVREPCRAFVRTMAPVLKAHAPHLVADDRKVGGSLMRIYRDTRFGKDKTPYKTNVGIHFRHDAGKDVHAPGLYVHLEVGQVFIGGGMWVPSKEPLLQIRNAIATQGARWTRIQEELPADYAREGDRLKRGPKGFDKEHPMIEELKWKSFLVMRHSDIDEATSPEFVERITADLEAMKPMMGFLCEAIGQPF